MYLGMQPTAKEGVNAQHADMAVGSITKCTAYAALYHSSREGTSALVLRFAVPPFMETPMLGCVWYFWDMKLGLELCVFGISL